MPEAGPANVLLHVVAKLKQSAARDSGLPAGTIVLKGHTETVYAVVFNADGSRVATGSFDQSVRFWDASTGKLLKTFADPAGHQRQVLTVDFSRDGKRVASGGEDNIVKIWDLKPVAPNPKKKAGPPAPLRNLTHPSIVDVVRFDPAGKLLATGCHDGIIRLWDFIRGQVVTEIRAHVTAQPAPIYCLLWEKAGDRLLSGSFDQSLKLWDARSGTLVREFKAYNEKAFPKGHLEGVLCASLSPDGKRLASGSSDRTIRIWNVADASVMGELVNTRLKGPTGPAPRQAHRGWVNGVAYTPDGNWLISVGNAPNNQGEVAVWNAKDFRLIQDNRLSTGPIYGMSLAPDGKHVALACGSADRDTSEGNAYLVKVANLQR